MIMLYFSGTGNSKYIAGQFCRHMDAECYSIEENLDFDAMITGEETIGFCYPVFFSRPPRIMREFAIKHMEALKGKKLILFCTQLILSGDAARSFMDMFPPGHAEVLYAEHFFMPNNVTNYWFLPDALISDKKVLKITARADRKMLTVCRDIKAGKVKKRGFNPISRALGLIQAALLPGTERKAAAPNAIRIKNGCTNCGICAAVCPMGNLNSDSGKIEHRHNCTLCYRCINKCPQKAITAVFHGKVKKQYLFGSRR
ncbi:MAG: EFR1 family ferrodoxin [Oscillospiraceae bacterium]|jgi:ferredoxin|nr:EFR1 family ferrodoxin [Oscillospiraceae bacterium]